MTSSARPVALVTGASSGIGASLAREFAVDGYDLVLTARRVALMQPLAQELAAAGAGTTIIAADLSQPAAAAGLVGQIEERGIEIETAVCNAGLGTVGRFDEMDPARIGAMLAVNVVALTELGRLLLPGMTARRRGRLMLVASTAAFQPGPQMAVYCATKAYVLSLGEAIAYELKDTGVTVTTLCPGATATEFSAVAGAEHLPIFDSSLLPPMSAAEVARIGYRDMKQGRRLSMPGLLNKIGAVGGRLSPRSLSLPMASWAMTPPGARSRTGSP